VVLAGRKLYVSNWGGRRPEAGDLTGPAGRGTRVRVDPVRFIACEGSVTVIDLTTGRQSEVITGLHASALAVSPDGRHVVCANAMSDSLSVIDTSSDAVVEKIWAKPQPNDLLGASPNALAFAPDGRTLIGTLEEIAKTFSALVFPADSQTGGSDTDILRYSLRVAFPGVAYTDSAGNFLGTLECVVHEIAPGRAYTSLLLDEEYSSDLSAWVGSNVVKEVN